MKKHHLYMLASPCLALALRNYCILADFLRSVATSCPLDSPMSLAIESSEETSDAVEDGTLEYPKRRDNVVSIISGFNIINKTNMSNKLTHSQKR